MKSVSVSNAVKVLVKIVVEWEDLKSYWKSEKNHSSQVTIYEFFKEFINHKRKTSRAIVFSCRCFPNIAKYCNHRLNFPNIRRAKIIQTQIEKFSWYIWKFRFTALQNYHWNIIKTRNHWIIKVSYDPT